MLNEEIEILLPECDLPFMIDLLYEIGPAETVGMGATMLSHLQIRAFQDNTGTELTPWQVKTLRSMSMAYCRQLSKSGEWNCPAPYTEEDKQQHNQDLLQRQFKSLLAGFTVRSYKKSDSRPA